MSAPVLPERFNEVSDALDGCEGWFVGGAIRDLMIGRDVVDVDIVVGSDDPEGPARTLAKAFRGAVFPLSEEFGAWRVVVGDGAWQVDLSPLAGGSLDDDLGRRDFTINAMAMPVGGGDVADPFDGRLDLASKRLSPVSRTSFDSDPLRVMRLARFASELGFVADQSTIALARESARGLAETAQERVFHELKRIIASDRPHAGLSLLEDTDALAVALPEISDLRGVGQSDFHHLDVHEHTLEVLGQLMRISHEPDLLGNAGAQAIGILGQPLADGMTRLEALRLAALLHDAAKPQTRTVMDSGRIGFPHHDEQGALLSREALSRLKASSRLNESVASVVRHHLDAGFLVHQLPLGGRSVHAYLKGCGRQAVDVTVLSAADRLATRGRNADRAIALHMEVIGVLLPAAVSWEKDGPPVPLLKGDEIASAVGIAEGPTLGAAVSELEAAQFAGEVENADQAIRHLGVWVENPGEG